MSDGNRTTWLILARGRKVRHWRVSTVAGLCAVALASSSLGGAIVGFSVAEPTVEYMVEADNSEADDIIAVYEARVAAMKRQIDTITHSQVTERRAMEARIAELLDRQRELTERQGMLGSVIQRAAGVVGTVPAPITRDGKRIIEPRREASLGDGRALDTRATGALPSPTRAARLSAPRRLTRDALAAFMPTASAQAPTPQEVFHSLDRSLASLDETQRESVTVLASEAHEKADTILRELNALGIGSSPAVGGPFVPLDAPFEHSIGALDEALGKLEAARRLAGKVPIGHPVKGQQMTSRFGPRRDPFNRKRAMHSGLDFRAPTGHPVLATGSGRVLRAGPNGGYGRFIEIDHGNGVTTRYAHLKRMHVAKGDRVAAGQRIGDVGSTGRSTGPHLHYEVRKHGRAVNPINFIQTGRSVSRYM